MAGFPGTFDQQTRDFENPHNDPKTVVRAFIEGLINGEVRHSLVSPNEPPEGVVPRLNLGESSTWAWQGCQGVDIQYLDHPTPSVLPQEVRTVLIKLSLPCLGLDPTNPWPDTEVYRVTEQVDNLWYVTGRFD